MNSGNVIQINKYLLDLFLSLEYFCKLGSLKALFFAAIIIVSSCFLVQINLSFQKNQDLFPCG